MLIERNSMKKSLIAVGLVAALALTACGGKKADTASTDAPSSASSTAATSGGFGSALDLGDGIALTITSPKTFVPGNFASNYLTGQAANLFDVTVKNGGTASLDASTILLQAASGANTCTDVLDGDNGINGAPIDPIAAGASVTFKFAIACDAKSGDPLTLSVGVGTSTASIAGKVA
jgi:ABC-type glycerol-3-phosphate transport system substrate-binding protein